MVSRIHYLVPYHKYWLDKETKQKNPAFTKESGFILSLKTPTNRDHDRSVAFYSRELLKFMKNILADGQKADISVLPSREKGKWSPGLVKIAKYVAKNDSRITFADGLIVRTKTIEKLATGGDRSISVHLGSLTVTPTPRRKNIVIVLDDVTTSGNSLYACEALIKSNIVPTLPPPTVILIALGKTT